MSDTFESHHQQLSEYRDKLPCVDGAIGLAAALGDHLVTIDIFDRHDTCRKVWDRLLSGVILDALELDGESSVDQTVVERALADMAQLPWQPTESVSEGNEYRAESAGGDFASALVLDDVLVHGSVVLAG